MPAVNKLTLKWDTLVAPLCKKKTIKEDEKDLQKAEAKPTARKGK